MKSCRTCKYVIAPNAAGCLCTKDGYTEFHAGLDPCPKYKMNPIYKGARA